ncbi:hypothetical protein BDV33DRAFT_48004 [Aspergillus novoparasiticus]|uniref:Uncharacterized protein n=1 Tax=Aspergillus novoparasiticus TaxID=986946 RepID=A0A5N6F1M0_9EURO|nr:hypothetical protein BDV33DRAFT_48004 [Aspergillus novoparasiticus]
MERNNKEDESFGKSQNAAAYIHHALLGGLFVLSLMRSALDWPEHDLKIRDIYCGQGEPGFPRTIIR